MVAEHTPLVDLEAEVERDHDEILHEPEEIFPGDIHHRGEPLFGGPHRDVYRGVRVSEDSKRFDLEAAVEIVICPIARCDHSLQPFEVPLREDEGLHHLHSSDVVLPGIPLQRRENTHALIGEGVHRPLPPEHRPHYLDHVIERALDLDDENIELLEQFLGSGRAVWQDPL